ncbi:hypothetical protein ACH5RR_008984 [Cinchona calisaya]|uniref:C3H1-type domain-containing protein n=1 Tax=Cinchona calisaya TaxID=153742 RepID=A0ABD3AD48_9GENT
MYGRGNYAAPVGHGPYTCNPPVQQRPPPPPPPFSQSPHLPLPTLIQQGPSPVPAQVGQLGRPVYQHAPPGPPRQGPPNPVLPGGINVQSFFTPTPPPPPPQPLQMHESFQMRQHPQWTHGAPFVPPTRPPAPRVLPPPASLGQTLFSSQVHQAPAGSMQAQTQPNLPPSSFYTSPPVGSFERSKPQLSDTASVGPPPLPPPPLPSPPGTAPLSPSPPPSTSLSTFSKSHIPIPIPAASGSAYYPEIGSRVNESSHLETSASGSLGGVSAPYLVGDAVPNGDGGAKTGSAQGENLISDLPPPPPKPADDRTVRSIQVLCQFIAKNGPEFENMTRRKEFENPEFKFLFGGESGSEAAVAHEYFLWSKRKHLLGFRSVGKQGSDDLSLTPLAGSSSHLIIKKDVDVPNSPADSDMDMEDDITHPDEEPQTCVPNELSHGTVSISNRVDKGQEVQPLLSTAEHSHAKDAADRNFVHSGSQGLGDQRQGNETSSNQNQPITRKSATNSDGLDANSCIDVECRLVTNMIKTATPHEDLSQPNTSADLAEIMLEKLPSQLVKEGASPFRLLQDYASDGSSENEACLVHAVPSTAVQSVKLDAVPIDSDARFDLGTDLGTKSDLESDKGLVQLPQSLKSQVFSVKPETVVEADIPSTTRKSDNFVDNIYGNQESLKYSTSQREPRLKVLLGDDGVDANDKMKENTKIMSSTSMVDRYGRLIREGASDSESGGSPRYNRRQGKRGRSRSRSRSPHDTRRRRSPRKRKERRGRSRSLSPRRRRSRSKSPSFRHGDEFGGDKMRRDKVHRAECFDFIRGKCYRGASCRYLHHEDRSDRSRSYRSKQQFQDLPYSSRNSDFHGKIEMPYKKLSQEHDEGRIEELKPLHDMPDTEGKKHMEEMDDVATQFHDKSGPLEPLVVPDANMENIPGDAAQGGHSPSENLDLHQSQNHVSDRVSLNGGYQHQQMDTYDSKSSPIRTPASIPSHLPVDKAHLNDAEDESHISSSSINKAFLSQSVSSQSMIPTQPIPTAADHLSHLPPTFALVSQDTNSSLNQEMPRDYNLTSPSAVFPSHSASVENHPGYQASVSYSHSQFPFLPNSSWCYLPPPPSHPPPPPAFGYDSTLTPGPYSGPSAHIMQNMLPPRNDFSSQTSARPYVTEFPISLNVGQNQAYPPMQELNRPLDHLDDLHRPMSHAMSESHGASGLAGKDHFAGRPVSGLYSSNSLGQDNMHSQTMPVSRESPPKRTQEFPGDNLPPADGVSTLPRDHGNLTSTLSSYTSELLDRSKPCILSDFGTSRISNHFNPYASTFEQPLSSKFSSNILQEKHRPFSSQLGSAYSFTQVPVDGRDVGLGSRNLMSSQNSAQAVEGILPRPDDGQYDPLYDSIEPSLNSVRKLNYSQKHEITDESDVIVRFIGSNKSLDENEHNKQKGGGSDEVSGSLENEDYGETADGEVGAVENGSPSNPNGAAETAAREVEIDQVKAPGKSKRNKESRSMKLFKVAIADFVKEVLKPSWRQGNMSKEAFKTIVKKTVDRVSGAMKSHQIPKSQSKINHYIDSSQRKLTKLVMGYVDKYVKFNTKVRCSVCELYCYSMETNGTAVDILLGEKLKHGVKTTPPVQTSALPLHLLSGSMFNEENFRLYLLLDESQNNCDVVA